MNSNAVVMCDFDGTIINIDAAQRTLELFASPQWRIIEKQFETGEVSFEESLQREYELIEASPDKILRTLDPITVLRPNFEKLIEYCKSKNASLIVVSGGLDFYIQHFLARRNLLNFITLCAPRTERTAKGYNVVLPKKFDLASINFKADLVKFHKNKGQEVFFVGNGLGDFPAARESQYTFAIKESRLAELCKQTTILWEEVEDFQQVIDTLSNF